MGALPLFGAVAIMAALAAGILLLLGDGGTRPVGGAFALEDTNGRTVTERDFRGRYMLIYFGYTHCPDVCPTTLHDMAEALDRLGPKGARVQPVFITVDPERDTPTVLRDYVAAIDPRLVALTGGEAEVDAVLRAYRVTRERHGASGRDELVDHSAVLYLMGPDGRLLVPLRADGPADRLADSIGARVS